MALGRQGRAQTPLNRDFERLRLADHAAAIERHEGAKPRTPRAIQRSLTLAAQQVTQFFLLLVAHPQVAERQHFVIWKEGDRHIRHGAIQPFQENILDPAIRALGDSAGAFGQLMGQLKGHSVGHCVILLGCGSSHPKEWTPSMWAASDHYYTTPVGAEAPAACQRRHAQANGSPTCSRGMARSGTAQPAMAIAAASASASGIERSSTGPASAEPTGMPAKFRLIETAKTRPNQRGSVRRWRSAKRPMSIGPAARPKSAIATTRASGAWISVSRQPNALRPSPATMMCRSRPSVLTRPASRPAITDATPAIDHSAPTASAPQWNWRSTSTGSATARMPLGMLVVQSVKTIPRNEGWRTT